ncbi:MAG: FlgD immunoglobulin-like domain containing protein [candidate division WOR-3 bacterium]
MEAEETEKISAQKNNLAVNIKPNPFKATTSIIYQLTVPTNVEIKILDATGQVIKTFAAGYLDKGVHRITWNGRDNNGERVNAGVYFLRIKTEKDQIQTKFILLK